jgi:hypothetical protein
MLVALNALTLLNARRMESQIARQRSALEASSARLMALEERVADLNSLVRSTSVPDLVGLSVIEATALLTEAGLKPAVNDGDSPEPSSVIVAQAPGAGEQTTAGARVGLRTRSTNVDP